MDLIDTSSRLFEVKAITSLRLKIDGLKITNVPVNISVKIIWVFLLKTFKKVHSHVIILFS